MLMTDQHDTIRSAHVDLYMLHEMHCRQTAWLVIGGDVQQHIQMYIQMY